MIKDIVIQILVSVVICNSIVKDFVDNLSSGENHEDQEGDHEDQEGDPEKKDIVKYDRYMLLPLFQINILYLECLINIHFLLTVFLLTKNNESSFDIN